MKVLTTPVCVLGQRGGVRKILGWGGVCREVKLEKGGKRMELGYIR